MGQMLLKLIHLFVFQICHVQKHTCTYRQTEKRENKKSLKSVQQYCNLYANYFYPVQFP